jgi:cysteine-rich repeat protein
MLLLAVQLVLGLAACFDPSYPTGIPCSENQSCPPGQTCDIDGICRYEPLTPGDPDAGHDPDAGRDPDGGDVTVPDAMPPTSCTDRLPNGDESDIDCGGESCPPCGIGGTCRDGDDCASGVCEPEAGRCISPDCGDGVPQQGEDCDTNAVNTSTCDLDCSVPACGDDLFNPFAFNEATANPDDLEACDTGGNSVDCDQDCTVPACGDGVNNPFVETCDEGAVNTEDCDLDCTIPQCGDRVFNPLAEICDEGANTEDCDQDCSRPRCGDVFINPVVGEECDAGGNNSICDSDCTFADCGDEFVNPVADEACDTGGNSTSCDADCTVPACGDGFINPVFGEECDDGATTGGDGCSASCQNEFPDQCATGTDPVSGSAWVICDADASTAWISSAAGGGLYHSDQICQSLGFSRVVQFGGNCNSVCGYCDAVPTSCDSPGTRLFDGDNGCEFPQLCATVTWECGR